MENESNQADLFTEIPKKGGTWETPLKPSDKVTIGINGVIGKELLIDDYLTLQIKTYQRFVKK